MRVLRGLKVWLILAVLAMSIWAPPRTAREVSPGGREEPEGKPTHCVAAISRIPFELSYKYSNGESIPILMNEMTRSCARRYWFSRLGLKRTSP